MDAHGAGGVTLRNLTTDVCVCGRASGDGERKWEEEIRSERKRKGKRERKNEIEKRVKEAIERRT